MMILKYKVRESKVLKLQEANSMFDKDLSAEEQMKLPNIEIKRPETRQIQIKTKSVNSTIQTTSVAVLN